MSDNQRTRLTGAAALAIYVAAIFLANWLIIHIGLIHVWPTPWLAPAGVYMAGLTFPMRDLVQRGLGRPAGIAAILIAAALTYAISPTLAFASGFTFLVSEGLDMAIYTPMARRRFTTGVLVSSTIAAIVDSLLFLHLAHIPYATALPGQIVGKLEVIFLVGLPVTWALRRTQILPAVAT